MLPPPAITSHAAFGPWHLVAAGTGAFIIHAYHTIVRAGGLKRIWNNFLNGSPDANADKKSREESAGDAGTKT